MEKEKKPEFVVNDRRKFTEAGEPRTETQSNTTEASVAPPPAAAQEQAEQKAGPQLVQDKAKQEEPVSGAHKDTGYNAEQQRGQFGGEKMDFVHLLDMLLQTAMMYAGAMETGTERRVDIVGLRQMIDLVGVLEEKTTGNLTEQEKAMLSNSLFQLRMTYMEIVSLIDRQAMQKIPEVPRK